MIESLGLPSPPRVLVVDDDEVDRERVRRSLDKAGIEVVLREEADPAGALDALAPFAPDVVLLDYNFPRHDGLTVLRDLRALDALVPVIVLTGHDETALAVELMKAGAVDYIPKSALTPQRLAQSLRHALRLRASEVGARAAEDALRASEAFNRQILESSHDCIKVLDLESRFLSMNLVGQRLFGIDDFDGVRGCSWLELWKDEHRRAAEAALAEARDGRAGRFVGLCRSMKDEPLWWDVLITPILGPNGEPERLLAISRDVTKQKRQIEFEQQLIGIVSHDLRNPVSAMIMAGAILQKKLPADSPLASAAKRVVTSGNRATRLIHDLLDFTQVKLAGRIPIARREADLHAVCHHAVEEIAVNNPGRPIVHSSQGDGRGIWDPDRIGQVVGNLMRNAVSYSPAGSPVSVSSCERVDRVEIDVHNEGPPIPVDVIPTLFQPFKRVGRTPEQERSIGLGLFIVREIVAAHGGAVTVRSSSAEGTTFSVDLPKG